MTEPPIETVLYHEGERRVFPAAYIPPSPSQPQTVTETRTITQEDLRNYNMDLDTLVWLAQHHPEFLEAEKTSREPIPITVTMEDLRRGGIDLDILVQLGQQHPEFLEAEQLTRNLEFDVPIKTDWRHTNILLPEEQRDQRTYLPESMKNLVGPGLVAKWWAATPTVAQVNIEMQGMSGRAYPWTAEDVLNIVSVGLLVGTAAYAIAKLPGRLAVAKALARRESIRQSLFQEAPEEEFLSSFGKQIEPARVWEQPTKTMWQNIQEPMPTKPEIPSWTLEELREARSYQPISLIKFGEGGTQIGSTEAFERLTWKPTYDLLQVHMHPITPPLSSGVMTRAAMLSGLTVLRPRSLQRSKLKQTLGIMPIQKQSQIEQQVQTQIQNLGLQQTQIQQQLLRGMQLQKLDFPRPQRTQPTTTFPMKQWSEDRPSKKMRSLLLGKYWMKKHPIPTPSQVLGFSVGRKQKRRKHRK